MKPLPHEAIAAQFHEAYERLAPVFGYKTNEATRIWNHESANGKLMMAVCAEVVVPHIAAIQKKLDGAHEALLFLVELKTMKRKIEAGTATEKQVSFYLAHKEDAWTFAEAVIETDITHERV